MSEENAEVARRFFDAINRQDYEAALAIGHSEIDIQDHPGVDAASWHHGPEGAWEWGLKLTQAFQDFQLHADEYIALDEKSIIVVGTVSGKGRISGVPVDAPFAAIVTVEDGLGRRVAIYEKKAIALRAAADLLDKDEAAGRSE